MKRVLLLTVCLCLIASVCLAADAPYGGYASTPYGSAAPSPLGYSASDYLLGADMGAGAFSKPHDLYVEKSSGLVYVADTGNARVVVLDSALRFVREVTGAGGLTLQSPKGVFADSAGCLYVADDGLCLVLKISADGALMQRYDRPISELYEETTPYTPQKVVADSAGRVYVLSQGVFQGLICFQADGRFLSFYGANHVEVTAKVALQKLLRMVMTREQWAGMESFIPIEYSNIDIDSEDMIYASVGTLEQTGGRSVFKLNPLGAAYRKFAAGALADVLDNERGVYTCLLRDTKEIVEFAEDTNGVLLTCGGGGTQIGLFQDPCAIARLGDDILALDRQSGAVTRFALTAFGRAVHEAVRYSADGRFQEAIALYKDILRMDGQYVFAYTGLGQAYYEMEEYETSMRYFKLANHKQGYSDAYKEYSTALLRRGMGWILGSAALLFLALRLTRKRRLARAAARRAKGMRIPAWRQPLYCMTHAYSGFEAVKLEGAGSVTVSLGLLGLLCLSSILSYVLTGFAFNPNRLERLNVPLLLLGSLGSFGLFYLSTLAVSSLMSASEGKPKELFIAESCALLPYILASMVIAAATNVLTLDTQPFVTAFMLFGAGWSAVLLVVGMMQVNQLTLKKTLLFILLSLLALVIILVLIVLLYSLVSQLLVFIQTLYSEMMYRL